jgi:hypothetical protein
MPRGAGRALRRRTWRRGEERHGGDGGSLSSAARLHRAAHKATGSGHLAIVSVGAVRDCGRLTYAFAPGGDVDLTLGGSGP